MNISALTVGNSSQHRYILLGRVGGAPLLFLCRMKTMLPLESKGRGEWGQGGGAVQD